MRRGGARVRPLDAAPPGEARADAVHAPALVPQLVLVGRLIRELLPPARALGVHPEVQTCGLHACGQAHRRCVPAAGDANGHTTAGRPAPQARFAQPPTPTWEVPQAGNGAGRLLLGPHRDRGDGAAGGQPHGVAAACCCRAGGACIGGARPPLDKHRVLHDGVEQPGVARVWRHHANLRSRWGS